MKTYWEYTELERSQMSSEEVQGLLDMHLMERGVLKIAKPVYKTVEPEPVLAQVAMFEAGDVIFDTAEKAEAFLKLNPKKSGYDYGIGYDKKFAEPVEARIDKVLFYKKHDLSDAKQVLSKNRAAKEFNEKLDREFAEASKKMNECLDEVWNNWHACKAMAEKHLRVIDTQAEYIKMSMGDKDVARTFLMKVFSEGEINDAIDWFASKESNQ